MPVGCVYYCVFLAGCLQTVWLTLRFLVSPLHLHGEIPPKKSEFIYEKLCTRLNFSHLQSTLRWMHCTY